MNPFFTRKISIFLFGICISSSNLACLADDRHPSEQEHYFFGEPKTTDNRFKFTPQGQNEEVSGITKLVRPGFVLGHYDKYKQPAWVCMRWTRQNLQDSKSAPNYSRHYAADTELPSYARANTDYFFSRTKMTKGHVARAEDNAGFGKTNFDLGNRMSNLSPQHVDLNGLEWLQLEQDHRNVVAAGSIDRVWIVAGPIFDSNPSFIDSSNRVAIPKSFYKIVSWKDTAGAAHSTGYVFPNKVENGNLDNYKTPISAIEAMTGLQFFPSLDAPIAHSLKLSANAGLWRHSSTHPINSSPRN